MSTAAAGNLLVAQGGGPTAVINCSLYGIIRQAIDDVHVQRIFGARHGITGVLSEQFVELHTQGEQVLEGLRYTPGAALGSCRYLLGEDDYPKIMEVLKKKDIRYFLYIGGNDSMDTAQKIDQLARRDGHSLAVIGVPKTVDNDLPLTDHSPGYGSAARFIAQSVRELAVDVGSLPPPVSIFETMGRNAGWLAAASTLAKTNDPDSAPHLIYLPEWSFDLDAFLGDVQSLVSRLGWALVVVSEGLRGGDGEPIYAGTHSAQTDAFGHALPGDVGSYLARQVADRLQIRCRSEKPGLLGRCSNAHVSSVDAREAEQVGRVAVTAALDEQSGQMVALKRNSSRPYLCTTGLVALADVANTERPMPEQFLGSDHHSVTPVFKEYVAPLIGEQISRYTVLRGL